jgi:ABC-type uncharacterized transport system permease subunit
LNPPQQSKLRYVLVNLLILEGVLFFSIFVLAIVAPWSDGDSFWKALAISALGSLVYLPVVLPTGLVYLAALARLGSRSWLPPRLLAVLLSPIVSVLLIWGTIEERDGQALIQVLVATVGYGLLVRLRSPEPSGMVAASATESRG